MQKKKLIISGIIGAVILIFIVAIVIGQINSRRAQNTTNEKPGLNFQPDFLSSAEKQALGITTDLRLQALTRNASGTVMVYKIIRADKDIINPNEIASTTPR